jgi:halogenation protein CepH
VYRNRRCPPSIPARHRRPEAIAQNLVSSSHSLANAADELDGRVGALHATSVVASAMSEGARVQAQALLGLRRRQGDPAIHQWTISTTDGVHWMHPSQAQTSGT